MTRRVPLSIASSLFLLASALAGTSPGAEAQSKDLRRMIAPYWSTQEGRSTDLMLNNPEARTLEVLLSLRAHSGELLFEDVLEVAPLESRVVSLNRLLRGKQASGHFLLASPASWGGCPPWPC